MLYGLRWLHLPIVCTLLFFYYYRFNNKGWASSVAYMNALNNILLRAHLPPGEDPADYGISVINHPMNFTQSQLQDELL